MITTRGCVVFLPLVLGIWVLLGLHPLPARNPQTPKTVLAVGFSQNQRAGLVAVLKRVKPSLAGLSNAEVSNRVDQFKKQIERSIAIIRKEQALCGPQIADCLTKLLKADAICLAFGMRKAASTGWDKCSMCKVSEGINLNAAFILDSPTLGSGQPAPLHDMITYQLVTNLMHEGGHLKDDGKPSQGSANAAAEVQAKVGEAEHRAHQRQLITVSEAKRLLDAIVNNKPLPKLTRALNRELLNDLNKLSAAEKRARALIMLRFICNRGIPSLEREVIRWQLHKNRWNQLLQNAINQQKLRKQQKQSRSFIRPDNRLYKEGKHAYIGGGGRYDFGDGPVDQGSTGIMQGGDEEVRTLAISGLDHVYDCWVSEDGGTLLVVGGVLDTEDGLMLGYADTNNDGFFEEGTRVEAIRSNELYGGTGFAYDAAAGQVLAFNRETKTIWGLGYSGLAGHEFPDLLENRGSIGFDRDDILHIAVSEDGLTAYGYGEEWDLPTDPGTMTAVATTSVLGGEFIPASPVPAFASAPVNPVFLKLPVAGDTSVQASGRAGSELVVSLVAGASESVIGQGFFDELGDGTVLLETALSAGQHIRVDDVTIGMPSVTEIVLAPRELAAGEVFRLPEAFYARFEGTPGEAILLRWGDDLSLPETGETTLDGYGSIWAEFPLLPSQPRLFVRGSTIEP